MSIDDQVFDKISGLVLNQFANTAFGIEPMTPELEEQIDKVVWTKISYEIEIPKVLGVDCKLLDREALTVLAQEITLEDLFGRECGGVDEASNYIARFPDEIAQWKAHVLSLID